MEEKKILIIEDDPDNQELMQEIINAYTPECSYDIVNDGTDALAKANDKSFDLVITEMKLSDKDGYEIVKNLRSNKDYESKPIVALTSYVTDGIEQDALNSGFNEYIAKPCLPRTIINVIQKYIESKPKLILS